MTAALEQALALLEADAPEEAAAVVEAALRDLPAASPMAPEAIARARALLARCVAQEQRLRRGVTEQMNALGASKRAASTYGR